MNYKFDSNSKLSMSRELTEEDFWLAFKDILFSDETMDSAEEEVEDIIELGGLESGQKILDMPCGIGRHSAILEDKGFDVVGVEKTEDYAQDAEENTNESEIINEDMKNFKREEEFNAVINWWNSFGYFENTEDDLKMLQNIHASLQENGVLLMDIFGKEISAMNEFGTHWSRESDALFLQDHEIKDDWSKIENTWIKVEDGEKVEFTWQQTLYSAQEMRQLLEKAGFTKIEFFGNVEGEPYDHEADRMVVKATK